MKNLRCIWWYLLCLVENENFQGGKQIILAWYSFAGSSYLRNGLLRHGSGKLEQCLDQGSIQCEVLAWSLDAKQKDTFFAGFTDRFEVEASPGGRFRLCGIGSGDKSAYISVCSPNLSAAFCCDGIEISLTGKRRPIREVKSEFIKAKTSVVSGLSAYRFHMLDLEGTLNYKGDMQRLRGIAYFQHVRSYLPLLPWDWCYSRFPDGSVAGVSVLRLGRDLLSCGVNSEREHRSKIELPIYSRGFFIDGPTGTLTRLTKASLTNPKISDSGKYIQHVEASDGRHVNMQWDVFPVTSHSLVFAREYMPFLHSQFSYKSSYGEVRNFSLTRSDSDTGNRTIEIGYCNLERAHGFIA